VLKISNIKKTLKQNQCFENYAKMMIKKFTVDNKNVNPLIQNKWLDRRQKFPLCNAVSCPVDTQNPGLVSDCLKILESTITTQASLRHCNTMPPMLNSQNST